MNNKQGADRFSLSFRAHESGVRGHVSREAGRGVVWICPPRVPHAHTGGLSRCNLGLQLDVSLVLGLFRFLGRSHPPHHPRLALLQLLPHLV